ncbi:efflux RND transporter permease subunit, partial [Phenylobacterium sp.]|uniref:efflux RND transporter permease subunit n=1 Tax=Phenylobacterium sp. TaxID=1871053 RepID=UPI002FDB0CA7
MTLSDLSVRRPVFAAVAAIILCVVGLASFTQLTVRELPAVDPPVISISTDYRGASAEVIEERITEVIERQVAGIEGVDRMSSSSRDGQSRINIEFKLSRNLDAAANDVRDAVSRVSSNLPLQADPPQIRKADADAQPIMFLSFSSTTLNRLQLTDYANRYLVERISTVPGVAQVGVGGAQNYAMRIWLDPQAMASRGITVDQVEAALSSQNLELPAGSLEAEAKDFTIRVTRGYSTPEEFARLPVGTSANGGYITRLGDIARVSEEPDERRRLFRSNGRDQVGIPITRQSQANDLEISDGVRALLPELNRGLPEGTRLEVAVDFTVFTRHALEEVWYTMGICLAVVGLVNFIFLGTWRAALIPTVVAPICILSSFIVLAPLGFSLNLLTLLALVLAIGLVVDDAIVVVENIQRRIDEGEPAPVAAQRGTRQVFFAVVATTIVLISVFAPLMFLPGYIGRLFVELAVAIAAAVAFSSLLALSLSPMLASKLLKPAKGQGWLAQRVDGAMAKARSSYHASLEALLSHRRAAWATGVLVVVLAGLALGIFRYLPAELVPEEDRGRVDINFAGPEGAGYDYTLAAAQQIEARLMELYEEGTVTRYLLSMPRFGGTQYNTGGGNVTLPSGRDAMDSNELAAQLNREFSQITAVRATAFVRPALRGSEGNSVNLIAVGTDYNEIAAWLEPIRAAAEQNPGLSRVRLDYEPTSPRLLVSIDRERAASLGVTPQAVGRALETLFGSRRVTTYIREGQEYDVILQTNRDQRMTQEDLNSLYVRTASGQTIPLASVVTTEVRGDTPDRERTDRARSIDLMAQLNPGYTIGDAISFFEAEIAKQPGGVGVLWGGGARDFLEAGGAVG